MIWVIGVVLTFPSQTVLNNRNDDHHCVELVHAVNHVSVYAEAENLDNQLDHEDQGRQVVDLLQDGIFSRVDRISVKAKCSRVDGNAEEDEENKI